MDKIKQQLVGGTFLIYLSINSFINGPYDNRITTIVAPYALGLLGLGLLIFGLVVVFSVKELSIFIRFALALSFPLLATGGSMLAFSWFGAAMRAKNMGLLLSNWETLLFGIGLILVGLILLRILNKVDAS